MLGDLIYDDLFFGFETEREVGVSFVEDIIFRGDPDDVAFDGVKFVEGTIPDGDIHVELVRFEVPELFN